MKRAVKDKWIADLTSGKYKQTQQSLKDGKGFCCLGVLAHGAGRDDLEAAGIRIDEGERTLLLRYTQDGVNFGKRHDLGHLGENLLGLPGNIENSLIDLNDNKEADFARIAKYIKHRVPVDG